MFNRYANIICAQLAAKLSHFKPVGFGVIKLAKSFATLQQRQMNSPANQHLFKSTNLSFKSDSYRMYVYAIPPICDRINTHQFEVGTGSAIALTFYPDTSETMQQNSYEQRKSCQMSCKEVLEFLKIKPRSGRSLLQTNQIESEGKTFTRTLSVSDLVDKKVVQIRVGQTISKDRIDQMLWEIEFNMEYIDFRVLQQHFRDNLGFITGAQLMLELDKENELHLVDSIPFKRNAK